MVKSLYREFYKFSHRKLTWLAPLIMLAFMFLMAGYPSARLLAMLTYDSSDAIMLVLVIVGSTMFSMEFQNNAILTLLYKSAKKIDVYFAKLVTILIYDLMLHVLAILVTILLTATIKPVSWMAVYQYGQPLLMNMVAATCIDIVSSMLIISLIFLET
ncbi:ABC transporter permease, partial [Lentilactobacillus parafarraginis]